MEKISEKKFYLLVLLFLSVFFLFYTALIRSCAAVKDNKDDGRGSPVVLAGKERVVYLPSDLEEDGYTVLAEDSPCPDYPGEFEIITIRLLFPQFGGCYIQIGEDAVNRPYLQEDKLPIGFSEVGAREAYNNEPVEVVSLDGGRGFISTDPLVQEILDTLELVD